MKCDDNARPFHEKMKKIVEYKAIGHIFIRMMTMMMMTVLCSIIKITAVANRFDTVRVIISYIHIAFLLPKPFCFPFSIALLSKLYIIIYIYIHIVNIYIDHIYNFSVILEVLLNFVDILAFFRVR